MSDNSNAVSNNSITIRTSSHLAQLHFYTRITVFWDVTLRDCLHTFGNMLFGHPCEDISCRYSNNW